MAPLSSARLLSPLLIALVASGASAQEAGDEPQVAQIDTLRAEIASQIQLWACDLIDELIFGWTQTPPFAVDTPVVLAGVTVPVGLGTGLEAMLENHFASVIVKNPSTKMTLAHCPQCTAFLVHSGAQGTVVSRGIDAPETLAKAGGLAGARHAVFLDFEAEGSSLVLRARITAIEPTLPIVYARTLSSSTDAPALLRAGDHLKTAAEARREYLDVLAGHDVFLVPLRVVVRSYKQSQDPYYYYESPGGGSWQPRLAMNIPPYVWLEAGIETAFTQERAWTASFSLGYTWAPRLHDGIMAEARFGRLVSGRARSLTEPDLYLFLGASAISIHGADALLFSSSSPYSTDLFALAMGDKPRYTFAAYQVGLQLRVKNRISAAIALEALPMLNDAVNLGNYLDLWIIDFETISAEVGFWF